MADAEKVESMIGLSTHLNVVQGAPVDPVMKWESDMLSKYDS